MKRRDLIMAATTVAATLAACSNADNDSVGEASDSDTDETPVVTKTMGTKSSAILALTGC